MLMNSYFRQQRLQHPADKIRRRGRRVIGASAHFNTRRSIGKPQRGQHRLQHQRTASGTTDSKAVLAAAHGARPEDQTLRPQLRAFHRCPTNFRSRFYRGQMLAQQPRFRSPGTNAGDGKWLAGYHRQAQRRAQDLPATFALCAIQRNHPFHHLSFYAHHLTQGIDNFHQIALCRHHRINIFIRHRDFVDHFGIFTAFHMRGGTNLIFHAEQFFRFSTAHYPPGTVAARTERLFISQPTDDKAFRSHRTGNNSILTSTRRHRAFTRHVDLFAKVLFFLHIVVVTVDLFHRQRLLLSYRFLRNALQRCYYVFHHCIAVKAGKKLRPGHRFQVIIKVFRTFHKVRQITRRQRFKLVLHLFLRQIDKVSPDGVTNSA
ncbi:hypothetical protein EcE24377A_3897 [Escherichia coli O139:H28 str. E24377A]|uniref:Uncharacterized protein n=1 Tax=Escherichia coli O139:H28 (strain E24377A / ETEC) TaxID=331111 RepID=A7ZSV0_ECO24|nr:hypothetical protein EcE24377A_3897 [Escherichia coli O139:H28 str. E24377A]